MSLARKTAASGKKEAPMPGPNSAAYRKIVAAKKQGSAGKSKPGKARGKSGGGAKKASTAFSTLKSRQMVVERVRRAIWGQVVQINDAIIALALAGNYSAAKALFDFAGVYTLPAAEESVPVASAGAIEIASAGAEANAEGMETHRMDAFFKSIGVRPPCDEPEPEGSTKVAL